MMTRDVAENNKKGYKMLIYTIFFDISMIRLLNEKFRRIPHSNLVKTFYVNLYSVLLRFSDQFRGNIYLFF